MFTKRVILSGFKTNSVQTLWIISQFLWFASQGFASKHLLLWLLMIDPLP